MQTPVILAVDDQEHIRRMLTVAFEMCGYHVLTARDGVDALRLLSSEPVDLLVTDWCMPVMNGEELTRHLGASHPELPIIVVSCGSTPPGEVRQDELGIRHWVRKPFRIKEIQRLATDILNDQQFCVLKRAT